MAAPDQIDLVPILPALYPKVWVPPPLVHVDLRLHRRPLLVMTLNLVVCCYIELMGVSGPEFGILSGILRTREDNHSTGHIVLPPVVSWAILLVLEGCRYPSSPSELV